MSNPEKDWLRTYLIMFAADVIVSDDVIDFTDEARKLRALMTCEVLSAQQSVP
jgi:hypothetical protein